MSTDQSTHHGPQDDSDAGLRVALRSALAQGDGTRLQTLEGPGSWRMGTARGGRAPGQCRASWGLGGGWQSSHLVGSVAVVIAAALGLQALRVATAPPLDDLLEPDVLSLVAFGEL
ncbi:MAG: hypothetical protein IPO19_22850 [Rhodoferax sp.]|nr:hypothetical protein [Rhodoferax sp.]